MRFSQEKNRSFENLPYQVIPIAEGIDFDVKENYPGILAAIEKHLQADDALRDDLLVSGYDARYDDDPSMPERTSTYARTLADTRRVVNLNSLIAGNPIAYSQAAAASDGIEPTIAIYDPEKMVMVSPEAEFSPYAPVYGETMETAKLYEFPIVYVDVAAIEREQAK